MTIHGSRPRQRQSMPDDLFRISCIQDAQLSPDGTKVVFSLNRVDQHLLEEFCHLWLLDLETAQSKQLTASPSYDDSPRWSPDGRIIAFVRTQEGRCRLFTLALEDGTSRETASFSKDVYGPPAWSPDGRWLAISAAARDLDPSEPITRSIYRFSNFGSIQGRTGDIFLVEVATGYVRRLTDQQAHLHSPQWSSSGDRLLVMASFIPESHAIYSQVVLIDLDGTQRYLWPEWDRLLSAALHPDGRRVLFIAAEENKPEGSNKHLWVADIQDASLRCLSSTVENGVAGLVTYDLPVKWEDDPPTIIIDPLGNSALTTVQNGGRLQVYQFDLAAARIPFSVLGGARSCIPYNQAGASVLFSSSDMVTPCNLYVFDQRTKTERRLTSLNSIVEEWKLPKLVELELKLKNDWRMQGWFLSPGNNSKQNATVLNIHGGPHEGYGHRFVFDFHLLSGAGYGVLFMNPPGSTGYGEDYATALLGAYGGPDYDAINAMLEHTADQGLTDIEQLGVTGLSYGGFMTCWLIGQSRLFKAAIAENPLTDWVSFYGTSDIGPYFAPIELGGHPWEIPEIYHQCSPLSYAHACRTPTLFLTSEDDLRCPAGQSEAYYSVLKSTGCTAEMRRFSRSPHTASLNGPLAARSMQNEALLDWFGRFLNPVGSSE